MMRRHEMKIAILDDEIYYCNKIEKLIHENKLLETCTIDKYTKHLKKQNTNYKENKL